MGLSGEGLGSGLGVVGPALREGAGSQKGTGWEGEGPGLQGAGTRGDPWVRLLRCRSRAGAGQRAGRGLLLPKIALKVWPTRGLLGLGCTRESPLVPKSPLAEGG